MRGSEVFAWRSFGDSMRVEMTLDAALVVTVATDDGSASVTLPTSGLDGLVEVLDGHDGCVPWDTYDDTARERDEALEALEAHRAEVTRLLAQLETLKTAVDLGDQRVRELEAAFDPSRTRIAR